MTAIEEVVDEHRAYEHVTASVLSLSKIRGSRLYPSARLLRAVEDFIGSQHLVRLEKVNATLGYGTYVSYELPKSSIYIH